MRQSERLVIIDQAELDWWMSVREKRSDTLKIGRTETFAPPLVAAEKAAMQREIDLLNERIDELREQRNSWQAQAELNTRLLEDRSKSTIPNGRFFGKPDKAA